MAGNSLSRNPGPKRVRPLTKRRSKRSKKALQFSYADLESGLVMRRKDSAEFSGKLGTSLRVDIYLMGAKQPCARRDAPL